MVNIKTMGMRNLNCTLKIEYATRIEVLIGTANKPSETGCLKSVQNLCRSLCSLLSQSFN